MRPNSPNIVRVDGRYRIGERLGTGSYAIVYRARDIFTNHEVAIKLRPCDSRHYSHHDSNIEHEYEVLLELRGCIGVSRSIWLGREGEYRAMVLERLGPSLQHLFEKTPSTSFSLAHVAKLGLQMLSRLESIHSCLFIHRDIKPHNFLMGVGEFQDTVFLIDFGIAQKYRHPSSRIHIPNQGRLSFVGTPAFASINSHLGFQLGRRDDIESLAYTLVYLQQGSLPWLTRDGQSPSRSSICDAKKAFLAEPGACSSIPGELAAVFHHARGLTFTQRPDYDHLRSTLQTAVDNAHQQPSRPTTPFDVPSDPLMPTAAKIFPPAMPTAIIVPDPNVTVTACKTTERARKARRSMHERKSRISPRVAPAPLRRSLRLQQQ